MTTPSTRIEQAACPFIGLRPFDEPDAPRFFGRDQQIAALLRRMAETRFLAVVGTSGCGKSSLVRAGLIPALKRGYLAGSGSRWKIAVMRPGGDPFGALAQTAGVSTKVLQESSLGLVNGLGALSGGWDSLLLVVDQFEELFRFRREVAGAGEQSDAFVKLLLASAGQDDVPVYVVLTMRSDYLGDCAVFRGLPEALNDAQYLVPVLTRQQLREVVEAPVRGVGAAIAPELVQRLLNDAGQGLEQELDQLPVLQHALMRTWGTAAGAAELGLEHYWDSGGMTDALNRHAQGIYLGLGDAARAVAKRVFQRLAERESKGRDIRRPTSFGELRAITGTSTEQLAGVVGQFRDFLTSRPDPPFTGATMIDVTHEALIRQWKELREWTAEEARSARVYLRLDDDAARGGRPWEDPDLSQALRLRKQEGWNSTWALRYTPDPEAFGRVEEFLRKSKRHRAWRWAQRSALVLALLAIPAAWYGWQVEKTRQLAELHRKDAEIERVRSDAGAAAARADRLLAQAANAHGEEKKKLEQDAAAERARSERLVAGTKDYQTLSQQREKELADLESKLKRAADDNSRLSGEKAGLEKRLTTAEAEKAELVRRLEATEKATEPNAAPAITGHEVNRPQSPAVEPEKSTSAGTVKVNPKDGLPYVWVPPGAFLMGCSPGDKECAADEKPAHEVTITKGFWMGQTEVTQAAYQRVMRSNPSYFKGANRPVEKVTWTEAADYCVKAGGRLPTEAEWEYAARGGTTGARYGALDEVAWYGGKSTHDVRAKQPNRFGLYDMLGNVWEWTADWYGPYSNAPAVDPKGPSSRSQRALRGGSWDGYPRSARVSNRNGSAPDNRNFNIGFRCAGEIP